MLGYPGIAPLTVATSGAAPGILVTSGSGDTYGWWPQPLVVNGNDARSAANLMAAVEGLTDRTNFLGQHMIDWVRGGTWASWTPAVAWGGRLAIDHSAVADGSAAIAARGGSGGGGIGVHGLGGGGNAIGVQGTATGSSPGLRGFGDAAGSGAGVAGTGGATGAGGIFVGGATSGNGVTSAAAAGNGVGVLGAGHGSGAGVIGVPGGTAGTPAVTALGGPVFVDTNIANTADPGINHIHAQSILKCYEEVVTDGAAGVALGGSGLNIGSFGFHAADIVRVVFAQPMADARYSVTGSGLGSSNFHVQAVARTTAHVDLSVFLNGASTTYDITNNAAAFCFEITGRM